MGLSHFRPIAPHPFVCWNKKQALPGTGPYTPQAETRGPGAGGRAGPPWVHPSLLPDPEIFRGNPVMKESRRKPG